MRRRGNLHSMKYKLNYSSYRFVPIRGVLESSKNNNLSRKSVSDLLLCCGVQSISIACLITLYNLRRTMTISWRTSSKFESDFDHLFLFPPHRRTSTHYFISQQESVNSNITIRYGRILVPALQRRFSLHAFRKS